jgi:hypothetical protein
VPPGHVFGSSCNTCVMTVSAMLAISELRRNGVVNTWAKFSWPLN